jgi:hypothetical protein
VERVLVVWHEYIMCIGIGIGIGLLKSLHDTRPCIRLYAKRETLSACHLHP